MPWELWTFVELVEQERKTRPHEAYSYVPIEFRKQNTKVSLKDHCLLTANETRAMSDAIFTKTLQYKVILFGKIENCAEVFVDL